MKTQLVFQVAITAVTSMTAAASAGPNIEQRYATTWSAAPIARIRVAQPMEANTARCRLKQSDEWGNWWIGRSLYHNESETVFHIPLEAVPPGEYSCQFDLRTPLGAQFVDGQLRVPVIARFTGQPVQTDGRFEDWPQRRFGVILCDTQSVWFAWDKEHLYVGNPGDDVVETVEIAPLPAHHNAPTCSVRLPRSAKEAAITWDRLSPAGPHLGQTLRVSFKPAPDQPKQTYDLLFVGSGKQMFFGANAVSHGPGGNDQGPDPALLRAVFDRTGLDLRNVGIDWGEIEPEPPTEGNRVFDFGPVYQLPGLHAPGLVYFTISLGGHWQTKLFDEDRRRFYELARPYVAALARELQSIGIRYISCGWNEPGLFHFSNRVGMFVENLNSVVEPLREHLPDAQVIAGKFCGGNPETIQQFTRGGFRDNFDILDIHPYSNDPRTGCHMGEVVASHEALAAAGMADKQIYLGEGWGPTRYTPGVSRPRHDDPVSSAEADLQRRFYWNGYRCLTSPRIDYNPEWVIGAKYFTFNDNVGETYWRVTARPHYNAQGEIDYYLLSHLRFDSLEDMKPHFYNGGLVDFYARPKGNWLFDFPPSLPDVRVRVEHDMNFMLRKQPCPITVHITNAESDPIRNLSIGLRERTALFRNHGGGIGGEADGPTSVGELRPGQTWTTRLMARVESGPVGPLRLAVEADYAWRGLTYTSDEIIRTTIRNDVDLETHPNMWTLDPDTRIGQMELTLRNNLETTLETPLFAALPPGLTIRNGMPKIHVEPGSRQRITVELDGQNLPGGTYRLQSGWDPNIGVTLFQPQACPSVGAPLQIDGRLDDWPADAARRGGIHFTNARVMPPDAPPDPFPVPVPMGESVLHADKTTQAQYEKDMTVPPKDDAFAATAGIAWDHTYLYFGAVIEDDQHRQDHTGGNVWKGDSIQLGIDALGDGMKDQAASYASYKSGRDAEGYGPDDYELAIALTPKGPEVWSVRAPEGRTGQTPRAKVAIRHESGFTTYEVALPWASLPPFTRETDQPPRLSILINNFDGQQRKTLEWGGGIGNGKYPSRFVPVVFEP